METSTIRRGDDRRRPRRRGAAGAAVLVALTLTAAGCRPVPCTNPAAMWQENYTGPETWPYGGTPRPLPVPLFDTDGDGVEDTIDEPTGTTVPSVTVHRASGDLVLEAEFGVMLPYSQPAGDLDGDGRSEISIGIADRDGNPNGGFFVPGATASGIHDPADAGIMFSSMALSAEFHGGDLDGDGADDLISRNPGGGPALIVSGADLMAAGPGGSFDGPIVQVPGDVLAIVPFTDRLDALVMIEAPEDVRLWVHGTWVRFTSRNSGIPLPYPPPSNRSYGAQLVDGPGRDAWLVVWYQGQRPGGDNARWAWDLDSLCGRPLPSGPDPVG